MFSNSDCFTNSFANCYGADPQSQIYLCGAYPSLLGLIPTTIYIWNLTVSLSASIPTYFVRFKNFREKKKNLKINLFIQIINK